MRGTCLELTHNHGSETDDTFAVNNGNGMKIVIYIVYVCFAYAFVLNIAHDALN